MSEKPRVGLGIIIENQAGEVLIGKRIGSHAQKYSIPGGWLDPGETFEAGAAREADEELGIRLIDPQVIGVTNNLETYRNEGIHSVSVILMVTEFEGTPTIQEPDRFAELFWADPRNLPEPHFDASSVGISNHLAGQFYIPTFE